VALRVSPKGEGIREGEPSPLHPPREGVTLPVTPLCHISLSTPGGERVRVRGERIRARGAAGFPLQHGEQL